MIRSCESSAVTAVLFAGGKGTRLHGVTGGRIPKSFVAIDEQSGMRVIDHLMDAFARCGIDRVIISTTDALRATFESFENDRISIACDRKDGDGTYEALLQIVGERSDTSQYLLLAQDNLFHADDLAALRRAHVPGQATWAVGPHVEGMDSYAGLHVDTLARDVIGDTKSDVQPMFAAPSVREYVRSNVLMIDPSLLDVPSETFAGVSHKQGEVDVYWDFLPHLLRRSIDGMREGKPSLLKASPCARPVVDFGRPERLATAREIYRTEYVASSPSFR